MCFVSLPVLTGIISLISINQLMFVVDKCSVLFEVGLQTKFLNVI
jgi:hypothetical protein